MSTKSKSCNEAPNLYSILGLTNQVCQQDDCDAQIAGAFKQKAKLYHPDRYQGSKKAEMAEVFELVTMAYDILRDAKTRAEYNQKIELVKQSSAGFADLKAQSTSYLKNNEYKPATAQQETDFQTKIQELNQKRGYDPVAAQVKLTKKDIKKKRQDLEQDRARQDETLKPQKLFEGDKMDPEQFNKLWMQKHQTGNSTALTPHVGDPLAWEPTNSSYGAFESMNEPFIENADIHGQNYGSIHFGQKIENITPEDFQKAAAIQTNYTTHNEIEDDYYATLKSRLREREGVTSRFNAMEFRDFKVGDMGDYGVLDKVSFKLDDKLSFRLDEEELMTKYEKMIAKRQQQQLEK